MHDDAQDDDPSMGFVARPPPHFFWRPPAVDAHPLSTSNRLPFTNPWHPGWRQSPPPSTMPFLPSALPPSISALPTSVPSVSSLTPSISSSHSNCDPLPDLSQLRVSPPHTSPPARRPKSRRRPRRDEQSAFANSQSPHSPGSDLEQNVKGTQHGKGKGQKHEGLSTSGKDEKQQTNKKLDAQGTLHRANKQEKYEKHPKQERSTTQKGPRNIKGFSSRSPSVQTVREYNRRISAYARRRDLPGALRTLAELDCSSSVSRNLFTYNAVINALVMCSQHTKADQFWNDMQQAGIQPNLVTFNTMLKSCFGGKEDDVTRAFNFLRDMEQRGIAPDRVTLNSLINACVSAGRVRDAHGVYEQMRRLNIEPDAYTFCTLAKQARHQCDVSMLDALLLHQLHHHTMLQRRVGSTRSQSDIALKISPVAYNTIADAYIRCGHSERALHLLERMRHPQVPLDSSQIAKDVIPVCPDVQTYNVRLKALRESGASASDAFAALDEMDAHGLEADHITLLTLADLCCRREEMCLAEGVLQAATDADIREHDKGSPEWKTLCNSSIPGSYLQSHNNSSRSHPTSGAAAAKFAPNTSGIISTPNSHNNNGRRNPNQPRNAKANAALFNALIRGYSSLDPPNVDRAVALYLEMRRYVDSYGFSWYGADSVTYTMLVDGFARIGDASSAERIISEMEAADRANVVAYNAYLKANRGNGFEAALAILERMKRAGLRPDVVTYNTVIDFLSSEENGAHIAEDLVRIDMPRNGVNPDLLTFNTLIKGVARNRGNKGGAGAALGAAYRWLNEIQARGLEPDEFTYQSMVSACAAAGDASRALEFFRKVEAERAKRVRSTSKQSSYARVQSANGAVNSAKASSSGKSSSPSPVQGQSLILNSNTMPSHDVDGRKLSLGTLSPAQRSNDWMLLPHPAAYVALMRAFLSSGANDGVDSVLLLRDEMVARGLELGRTGYTAVADAYAERADIDSAEATLGEMLRQEIQSQSQSQTLSPVHHCIRMKALCNAGRLDDAIAIIPEVENADAAVFNVLIFACVKNKDTNRLILVLREMEARQVQPDAITSRAMTSMMRTIARALKSFDSRFVATISKFMSEKHSELKPDGIIEDNSVTTKSDNSIWKPDGSASFFKF